MTVDLEAARQRARRLALDNAVRFASAPRASSVLGALLGTEASLRSAKAEVERIVEDVVREVAALSPAERQAALEAAGGPVGRSEARVAAETKHEAEHGLPPLPDAVDGKVVLRFAPFPSGRLHLGHGRPLFINDEYRRRYHGKFYLVFDDTIGSEEKHAVLESYEMILEDLDLVGVKPDAVYYKSDLIPNHYRWAPRLIEKGVAYVCTCSADLLRENRRHGIACAERALPPTTQQEAWEGMLGGRYPEGGAVLRLKTDLQHPDPAFRDRVLCRISDREHPRVGRRYRVWPMLEFSWAVDDIELGVTHVARGKELVVEDQMELAIWNALGITGPTFLHWGLLQVREVKLSKSKSQREVENGTYDGWADPRTWSFASLRRRGLRPEALRQFVLSFGMSLADIEVPAETLYAENRRVIDPTSLRRAFVQDPVTVRVAGAPPSRTVELANHPELPALGHRTVAVGQVFHLARADVVKNLGKEVRLKDLMNIRLPDGPLPAGAVEATFTSLPNKSLPRIQWVSDERPVPVAVLGLDGSWTEGQGEASLAEALPGQVFQFERFGFVAAEANARPSVKNLKTFVFGHP